MRPTLKLVLLTLPTTLVLAACGGSSSSSSTAAGATQTSASASASTGAGALVRTASNAKLGRTVLVNAQGMTLYHLSGEQNGKFICTSATCVKAWPPLKAGSSSSPSGAVGSLGTVKRPDGTEQVTYKGTPLYTFVEDKAPGQANGQGVRNVGVWTAVTSGAAPTSAPAAPATTTSSTSRASGY